MVEGRRQGVRIAFVIDRVLPVGASAIGELQIFEAAKRGHDVYLVTSSESSPSAALINVIEDMLVFDGLGSTPLANPLAAAQALSRKVVRSIGTLAPDALVVHNYGRLGGNALLLEMSCEFPTIVWAHDEYCYASYHYRYSSFAGDTMQSYEPWDAGQIPRGTHLQLLQRASRIRLISPSLWLKKQIDADLGSQGPACMHIPNGIDSQVFHSDDQSDGAGKPTILCVGNVADPRKNIPFALRAIARAFTPLAANALHIVLVGGNPDGYSGGGLLPVSALTQTRQFLLGQGVPRYLLPRISTGGWVSDPETMRRYYSRADLVVHPSQIDNYPTVCLEARACGVPVIATAVGGTTETLGAADVAVPFGDETALIRQLRLKLDTRGCPPLSLVRQQETSVATVQHMWDRVHGLLAATP